MLVIVKDSILRDRPTNEREVLSVSAEGVRVRRRRKPTAIGTSLSPEVQRFHEAESTAYQLKISCTKLLQSPHKLG